jgi:hypothetical protein
MGKGGNAHQRAIQDSKNKREGGQAPPASAKDLGALPEKKSRFRTIAGPLFATVSTTVFTIFLERGYLGWIPDWFLAIAWLACAFYWAWAQGYLRVQYQSHRKLVIIAVLLLAVISSLGVKYRAPLRAIVHPSKDAKYISPFESGHNAVAFDGQPKSSPSADEVAAAIVEQIKKSPKWSGAAETPKPNLPPQSSGFVQYEGKTIFTDNMDSLENLRVGYVLRMKFAYANRGARPVDDVQTWGIMLIIGPDKNPGTKLRQVFLHGIKNGYENKFKGGGSTLGVNQEGWNFAVGTPITQEQLDGLNAGTLRIHMLVGGGWRDEKRSPYYWTECEWTNWPHDATPSNWLWKTC